MGVKNKVDERELDGVDEFAVRYRYILPKQVRGPPLKSTYPAPRRAFLISSPLAHLCGR